MTMAARNQGQGVRRPGRGSGWWEEVEEDEEEKRPGGWINWWGGSRKKDAKALGLQVRTSDGGRTGLVKV
jgi:hypothetical protein